MILFLIARSDPFIYIPRIRRAAKTPTQFVPGQFIFLHTKALAFLQGLTNTAFNKESNVFYKAGKRQCFFAC